MVNCTAVSGAGCSCGTIVALSSWSQVTRNREVVEVFGDKNN